MKVDSKHWSSTNKTQKNSNLMRCSQVTHLHEAKSWHRWAGWQVQDPGGKSGVLRLQRTLCQQHKDTDFNYIACFLWEGRCVFEIANLGKSVCQSQQRKDVACFPKCPAKRLLEKCNDFWQIVKIFEVAQMLSEHFSLTSHTLFNSSYFNNPNNEKSSGIRSLF